MKYFFFFLLFSNWNKFCLKTFNLYTFSYCISIFQRHNLIEILKMNTFPMSPSFSIRPIMLRFSTIYESVARFYVINRRQKETTGRKTYKRQHRLKTIEHLRVIEYIFYVKTYLHIKLCIVLVCNNNFTLQRKIFCQWN